MYGVNPFVACSGSGWINVYMYQMWKDECQKYLPLQVIQRLERDSGYKNMIHIKLKTVKYMNQKQFLNLRVR